MSVEDIKIIKVEQFSEEDLIERLKKITMLKAPDVAPYEDAFISLERIAVKNLASPQRYVLKEQLHKIRKLKWALEEHNIDIFNLEGFVRLTLNGYEEQVDLLPAIVEESIEKNGHLVPLVNDGMHRAYLAYLEWVIPQVVYIRGLPKHLPYYSFPIPENDWSKIELLDDIPRTFIKKWHRIENNKELYRNFNSAFKNVGGPRGSL